MRRAARRTLLLIGVLLSLVAARIVAGKSLGGWVLARERARFERAVGPLDPASLAAPSIPDDQNAARALAGAIHSLTLNPDENTLIRRVRRLTPPSTDDLTAVRLLTTRQAAALARLRAAAALAQSSFGPRPDLFHGGAERFALAGWLWAAQLVSADGREAIASGDDRRLDADLATLHGITRVLRREPVAFFGLLGGAAEEIQLDLLRHALARGMTGEGLARAELQLTELARLPGPAEIAHGEAVFGAAMLERPFAAPPAGSFRERAEALLWPWSEGHVIAGYLVSWGRLAGLARRPQASWPPDRELAESSFSKLRRWLDPTAPLPTVRDRLLPTLLDGLRKLQVDAAIEQLAGLTVGLARRASLGGDFPSSLGDLPGAERPDPASGTVPAYTRTEDHGARIQLSALRPLAGHQGPTPQAMHEADARRQALTSWRLPPIAPPGGGR